ncbi:hypothetical protein FAF44_42865 [Nonomuraea sp. MG754425]|uniref:hypothetical protein n=1 Tax=Nonomuraea sp. MG754425 TaxID=2570319 RepID=UPI001F1790F6|nr:hypothetical protein [Nonomuraea sp. MG754425]MCF6475067.1 hypothetical protein [Nonomuraea sp. MG754425]
MEEHDAGGRCHLAEVRVLYVEAEGGGRSSVLFGDLRQDPDEEWPAVHVDLDEVPVLRLSPSDAVVLGWMLVELGVMGGGR